MTYENLDNRVDAITITALNKLTAQARDIFQEEIPSKSGELRQSVKMTPAKKLSNGTFSSQIIINKPYARAVDLGIPPEEGQYQTASKQYMVFDDWPGGPDELRWADGKFHFKSVRHVSRADHYSQRAMKRIRGLGKKSFFQSIKDGISRLFRK